MESADRARHLLGRLGVWSSLDQRSAVELTAYARLVEELGYDALWANETTGREPFALLGALTGVTDRITLGLGIASLYARDAVAAHAGARSIAELSGGRFVMGLGVSHHSSVTARGHLYGPPLETVAGYLDAYDRAPYTAFPPAEEPPLVLAALGPRMLALAATRTQGAFAYLVTEDAVREARRTLDEAAQATGLATQPILVVTQAAILELDPTVARQAARRYFEHHLAQPNYGQNLRRMGFGDADLTAPGSDRLADALVAWGDEVAIRRRLEAMADAGADHVALIPLSVEGRQGDERVTRALAPGR